MGITLHASECVEFLLSFAFLSSEIMAELREKSEPKQRKSSLATAASKTDQRKKSVTMDVERNETVEFEKGHCDEEAEEDNKDNFDLESPSEENMKTSGRKFSRFNDSMKINKRR